MDIFSWFFIFLVYLPFQIALNLFPGADLASSRLFIVLLFLFWLVLLLKKYPFSAKKFINLQTVCLFLLLILAAVSLFKAENIGWGIRKIIFFLSLFPIYFLAIALADCWLKIKRITKALIFSGILISLIGLSQFFAQFIFGLETVYRFWASNITPVFSGFNFGGMILTYPSWLVDINGVVVMRAFSLFSDPHMFSFYLGLLLPLTIIRLSENKFIPKFIVFCLFFISLLVTFTRGAYFGVIAAFLIMAFLFWRPAGQKKVSLILCLSLLVFLIPGTPFAGRFYSSFDLAEGSNQGRLEMWQQANKLGWQNIWQGVGLGNYSLTLDSGADYRNPTTAHNLYLDFFSETGIFSLIVWLVLILSVISRLFFGLKTASPEQKRLSIALIGSLTYFSVHSFFETAIFNPIIFAILLVFLGLANIIVKQQKSEK